MYKEYWQMTFMGLIPIALISFKITRIIFASSYKHKQYNTTKDSLTVSTWVSIIACLLSLILAFQMFLPLSIFNIFYMILPTPHNIFISFINILCGVGISILSIFIIYKITNKNKFSSWELILAMVLYTIFYSALSYIYFTTFYSVDDIGFNPFTINVILGISCICILSFINLKLLRINNTYENTITRSFWQKILIAVLSYDIYIYILFKGFFHGIGGLFPTPINNLYRIAYYIFNISTFPLC